jgi:hypothetical protein
VAHFFEGIFTVWELVKSGGWMMLPIILSSVAALGIIVERLWTLRASRVTPPHLLGQVWVWIKDKQLDKENSSNCAPTPRWAKSWLRAWPTPGMVARS